MKRCTTLKVTEVPLWADCPWSVPLGIEVRRVGPLVCLHSKEFGCGVDFELSDKLLSDQKKRVFDQALHTLEKVIVQRKTGLPL